MGRIITSILDCVPAFWYKYNPIVEWACLYITKKKKKAAYNKPNAPRDLDILQKRNKELKRLAEIEHKKKRLEKKNLKKALEVKADKGWL